MSSNDSDNPDITVALAADIDVGCALTWAPTQPDFGSVILNTQTRANVALSNDGTSACEISGLAITADSDPGFGLPDTQARSFSVAAGNHTTIAVVFAAADSSPPQSKSGTLVFETSDVQSPRGQVALSGYISTVCVEASRWVYTVDVNGTLSRFDPRPWHLPISERCNARASFMGPTQWRSTRTQSRG